MSANELADELDAVLFACGKARPFLKHAAMLRQQQAEIEALKALIDSLFAGLDSSLALNKAQIERNK